MKNIIICISFIFCLYISIQAAMAESVDVYVPQREVTMHSSQMAKNFDNAAKKVKESYSKDKSNTTGKKTTDTGKSKNSKKIQQTQQRKYTSEWT